MIVVALVHLSGVAHGTTSDSTHCDGAVQSNAGSGGAPDAVVVVVIVVVVAVKNLVL